MPRIYPRATEAQELPTPVNALVCIALIIDAKEHDIPKEEAIGACLAGCDDVRGFELLWREIDNQVIKARKVNPADYDTVTQFKAEVSKVAPLLDSVKWYDGLKAELQVVSYDELVAKVDPVAVVAPVVITK